MQHIHTIQQYVGCYVGYNDTTIRPTKSVHNVGCSGLNKHLFFEEVLNIAYTIHHPLPNIIVMYAITWLETNSNTYVHY